MSLSDENVEAALSTPHGTASGVGTSAVDVGHAEVRRLLSDLQDGELSPPEADLVRRHLDRCDSCRAFKNTLRGVVDLTGDLPRHSMPKGLKQKLLEQAQPSPTSRS